MLFSGTPLLLQALAAQLELEQTTNADALINVVNKKQTRWMHSLHNSCAIEASMYKSMATSLEEARFSQTRLRALPTDMR